VQANYAVFETLVDQFTTVFQCGRYIDRLVVDDGRLRFREEALRLRFGAGAELLVFPI
jgi:3-phenylpropionate/cinnamic acid dioxygenase small subunit